MELSFGRRTGLLLLFGLITLLVTKCYCKNINEKQNEQSLLSKEEFWKTRNKIDAERNGNIEVNQLLKDWKEKKMNSEEFLLRHWETLMKYFEHVKNKVNNKEYHKKNEEEIDHGFLQDDPNVFDLFAADFVEDLSPNINELIKIWHQLLNSGILEESWMEELLPRSQTCTTICHVNGRCDGRTCICKLGFAGDGITSCEDIDECKVANPCQQYEECLNIYGSFACQCLHGFRDVDPSDAVKCIDIDECMISNSCKSNQVCINTIGSFSCQCRYGYEDVDLSDIVDCQVLPILECSPERIKIRITFNDLQSFLPVKNAMSLNPDVNFKLSLKPQQNVTVESNCTIKSTTSNTSAVYRFIMFPPFQDCGTKRTTNFSGAQRIVYENIVWWTQLIPGFSFLQIPFQMFDVKCEFPAKLDQNKLKMETSIRNTKYSGNVPGQANITMKFWDSPPGSISKSAVDLLASYEIGKVLYVAVELNNPAVFGNVSKLLLNRCYVSSSKGINQSYYLLIENGCNAPVSLFFHGILENGRSSVSSFFFQMFKFQPLGGALFVHCDVTICQDDCKPQCLYRRRRSNGNYSRGSNDFNGRGATGSIPTLHHEPLSPSPNKPANDKAVAASSVLRQIVIPSLLIASNVVLLILLGLLSYAIARTLAHKRRQERSRLDQEGIIVEALGHSSISTPPHQEDETISNRPVWGSNPGNEEISTYHSFCDDKNCIFMKSKKSGKRFPIKKSKKSRRETKEVKQLYDLSTLTCPTPFNSPPPSPTIPGHTTSVGTSPIRVIDDTKNMPSTSKGNLTETR